MEKRELISVCAWCKKVEVTKGIWESKEIPDGKLPSHGICPECAEKVRGKLGLPSEKKSNQK